MEQREFEELLLRNREERHLEYKTSMNWSDKATRFTVTKEILALANLVGGEGQPGGGSLILGVSEDKQRRSFVPVGMAPEDAATFSHDAVADFVAEYAEPYAEFHLSHEEYQGCPFVWIQVREFRDTPVLCRRDGGDGLERGRLYVRTPGAKPEAAPVRSHQAMREILDRAMEIGTLRELDKLRRYGLIPAHMTRPSHEDLFSNEIEGV